MMTYRGWPLFHSYDPHERMTWDIPLYRWGLQHTQRPSPKKCNHIMNNHNNYNFMLVHSYDLKISYMNINAGNLSTVSFKGNKLIFRLVKVNQNLRV